MATYEVKCANTDGSGFDVVETVDSIEKWYDQQHELLIWAKEYSAGGGSRFGKFLTMQQQFWQEAKDALINKRS